MADILLQQLSKLYLPGVGSLEQIDDFTFKVAHRPLSIHMNELVRVGTLLRSKLQNSAVESSSFSFDALADLHMDHLTHQRNDAVKYAPGCQRKKNSPAAVSRLSRENQLATPSLSQCSRILKLWCDDFKPSNVLLNENLQIVGLIDLEFTYAAPTEISSAPPWWLLIEQIEYWPDGIEAWMKVHDYRLQTFLKVLIKHEDALLRYGRLEGDQMLSGPMREKQRSGIF
jgi:hypothetical protein